MLKQIKTLIVGMMALIVVAGIAWWLAQALLAGSSDLSKIDRALAAIKPMLLMWRLALIAGLVVIWPWGCRWLAQQSSPPLEPSAVQALIRLRWKLLVILVAVELILVQRVLF